MDSIWVSGTQDPGSIPGGATIKTKFVLGSYRDLARLEPKK